MKKFFSLIAVLGLLAACSGKEDPGQEVPVKSIDLKLTRITLETGDSEELSVKVYPANATARTLTWASSNPEVAQVTDGMVVAKATGKTEITVTCGDLTDRCEVKVILPVLQEPVDLGLSVRWAPCNVGAEKPDDRGDYFAWGETEPQYYSKDPLRWKKTEGYTWNSYKWCFTASGKMIKYCPTSLSYYWYSDGEPDGKTKLEREDDAASENLGRKWRTPTDAEWQELISNCTWEKWLAEDGIYGRKVTSKINGNSIFLPGCGCAGENELGGTGGLGFYMSSSLYTEHPFFAWYLSFLDTVQGRVYQTYRYYGLSVRPVFMK